MRLSPLLRTVAILALLPEAAALVYVAFGGDVPRDLGKIGFGAIDLAGLKIDGERIGAGDVREVATRHAKAMTDRRVDLDVDGKKIGEVSLSEMGVHADIDGAVAQAKTLGNNADLLERLDLGKRVKRGDVDLSIASSIDPSVLYARISEIKETEDTSPISARLDLDHHAVIPEKAGSYIDFDGAIEAILHAANDKDAKAIELPIAHVAPRVSSEFLSKLDIHTVLSEYETYFSRAGDQSRRGKNIDVASSKLDGLVLSPGELVSFNNVVGDRSEENGFQKSWEIYKGEMVEGIGGGTCQVASTLHAAVFFAGLDVIERLPHSRPSAYIPMGLDSTVVYPIVDLKIRNPFSFPIVVHTTTDANKLKVELLGADRPAKVGFGREILARIPYPRKVVEDAALHGKKVIVKQHGMAGFRIKRSRVITLANGTRRQELTTDTYPPTTEIYEVPEGFDEALLPPLPVDAEDAKDANASVASDAATKAMIAQPIAKADAKSTATVACAGDCAKGDAPVVFVDAPGAHTPTTGQINPAKSMWMNR
jgi:vancomycin resistance protein YoaR